MSPTATWPLLLVWKKERGKVFMLLTLTLSIVLWCCMWKVVIIHLLLVATSLTVTWPLFPVWKKERGRGVMRLTWIDVNRDDNKCRHRLDDVAHPFTWQVVFNICRWNGMCWWHGVSTLSSSLGSAVVVGWSNDGCRRWWMLVVVVVVVVVVVTQCRLVVVVVEKENGWFNLNHWLFKLLITDMWCSHLNNLLCNNCQPMLEVRKWCDWLLWRLWLAWLNLSGNQNYGRVAPHPSFRPQLVMPSRATTHLWFSWCCAPFLGSLPAVMDGYWFGIWILCMGSITQPDQDPVNSSKMLDTKNADFRILVHTNFRRVGPDFI